MPAWLGGWLGGWLLVGATVNVAGRGQKSHRSRPLTHPLMLRCPLPWQETGCRIDIENTRSGEQAMRTVRIRGGLEATQLAQQRITEKASEERASLCGGWRIRSRGGVGVGWCGSRASSLPCLPACLPPGSFAPRSPLIVFFGLSANTDPDGAERLGLQARG